MRVNSSTGASVKPLKLWIGVAVVCIGIAAFIGCYQFYNHRGQSLTLPGTVEIQEVRLGSKLGGRIKTVSVREGQTVRAGDEIARFETPELDAQHEQLKAKLAAAQADLDKAEAGPRQQEIDEAKALVAAADARWQKAQKGWREEEKRGAKNELEALTADVVQARADFERVDRLWRESPGAVTKADYDAAKASRDRALNNMQVAQARYDMLMTGSRPEDIAQAAAELDQAKAKLALLLAGTREEDKALARARVADARAQLTENEANLREAIVRSPSSAVIEVLSVRPGDLLAPNAPIARILNADDLWVKVFVPETELGKLRLGQAVEVTVDSYPNRRFAGTVDQIANQAEFTPRNVQSVDERKYQVFAVKVRVDNREGIFKSGMAAEVLVPLAGAP
jgi:multidrug resistance efflux pump